MSLTQQIKALSPGESFITKSPRTGVYVAAKRVNVTVKTDKVSDTETRITRVDEPAISHSVLGQVKALRVADRLKLFESFELCCGMDRGQCVCEKEVAPVVDEIVEPIDDWYGWSEEKIERANGEKITFRVHHKRGTKRVIKTESDWDSFA
jgi:hypothetical protein